VPPVKAFSRSCANPESLFSRIALKDSAYASVLAKYYSSASVDAANAASYSFLYNSAAAVSPAAKAFWYKANFSAA
jgi:hypothetical protein